MTDERSDDTELDAAEASRAIGVSQQTLRTWRNDNLGPRWSRRGPYPRSRIIYRLGDLRAWKRQRAEEVAREQQEVR